jgi:hypothetical protein
MSQIPILVQPRCVRCGQEPMYCICGDFDRFASAPPPEQTDLKPTRLDPWSPVLANAAQHTQRPPERRAQVVRFRGITRLDLDAAEVLRGALEANLKTVVVVGYDAEGEEYFASSMADGADALWLMERLKNQLLNTVIGSERGA